MRLTRFEVLALLPDKPDITGFGIEVSPSGRVTLEEWTLGYETVVDGLPERFDARLVWHKGRTELGPLILVKAGAAPPNQVNFYLKPDLGKVKKRYRLNSPPAKPKP
ncbi:MAG: hypothetical protein HYR56_21585 [Acidobacteria bacterium]|nr:hypothetical protein [Acidobacteriota bacterium]MBI3425186.1 hypothetical protein [Acidobacteriota bacterium]